MSRINGFVGRRNFLKFAGASLVWGTLQTSIQTILADTHSLKLKPVNPDVALRKLLNGNIRFIHQNTKQKTDSLQRLRSLRNGQNPFASILGCADSRVPTEIIFDQGLGDLFVVRVAGNVATDMIIGSLEYSTSVLGSQLIVVLGHRKCGAVIEAIDNHSLPGKIGLAVEEIKPAIETVKLTAGDIQEDAVLANVQYQVKKLYKNSDILSKLVAEKKLKIVGAVYDIDTGKVTVIT
jgi:carbonic anhydrase